MIWLIRGRRGRAPARPQHAPTKEKTTRARTHARNQVITAYVRIYCDDE